MNKKSVYRNLEKTGKDRFAKFSDVSQTEKMLLQNFPAFLQPKNGFAKFSGVSQTEKMLLQFVPTFPKSKLLTCCDVCEEYFGKTLLQRGDG